MTICIAGIAYLNSERVIVTCSDWRSTSPTAGRADTVLKTRTLAGGWSCMLAGSVVEANALWKALAVRFAEASTIDETNASLLVQQAVNERKYVMAEEMVQGRYGITYERFLDIGKDRFPDYEFRNTFSDIGAISIKAHALVYGFDGIGPVIIHANDRCKVRVREEYALIGEGEFLAEASLRQRQYSDIYPLSGAMYFIYEAKKQAERMPSVSEMTAMTVMRQEREQYVPTEVMNQLKAHYKEYGPRECPIMLPIDGPPWQSIFDSLNQGQTEPEKVESGE